MSCGVRHTLKTTHTKPTLRSASLTQNWHTHTHTHLTQNRDAHTHVAECVLCMNEAYEASLHEVLYLLFVQLLNCTLQCKANISVNRCFEKSNVCVHVRVARMLKLHSGHLPCSTIWAGLAILFVFEPGLVTHRYSHFFSLSLGSGLISCYSRAVLPVGFSLITGWGELRFLSSAS